MCNEIIQALLIRKYHEIETIWVAWYEIYITNRNIIGYDEYVHE